MTKPELNSIIIDMLPYEKISELKHRINNLLTVLQTCKQFIPGIPFTQDKAKETIKKLEDILLDSENILLQIVERKEIKEEKEQTNENNEVTPDTYKH